jgi:prepilin-type N-terminal cleavage/methylation domain-containing protein
MKTALNIIGNQISRRAFTLVELLVASSVGAVMAGSVVLLLYQSATEQRNGFADMTVEEKAYTLQANLTACLRSMSANQGLTPDYSSGLMDTNGNLLGYQSVFVFSPATNGGYTTANISCVSSNGLVVYTPDISAPSVQTVWMSNTTTAVLNQFCLSTSLNLDGSQNGSLVNVRVQMNDNGFSGQGSVNNPTSIYRNFSVQMRNDN